MSLTFDASHSEKAYQEPLVAPVEMSTLPIASYAASTIASRKGAWSSHVILPSKPPMDAPSEHHASNLSLANDKDAAPSLFQIKGSSIGRGTKESPDESNLATTKTTEDGRRYEVLDLRATGLCGVNASSESAGFALNLNDLVELEGGSRTTSINCPTAQLHELTAMPLQEGFERLHSATGRSLQLNLLSSKTPLLVHSGAVCGHVGKIDDNYYEVPHTAETSGEYFSTNRSHLAAVPLVQKSIVDPGATYVYSQKTRRSVRRSDARPSGFCHICNRKNKQNLWLVCANVARGICRKVICTACTEKYRRDDVATIDATVRENEFTCHHCRRVCPPKASCVKNRRMNCKKRAKRQTRTTGQADLQKTVALRNRGVAYAEAQQPRTMADLKTAPYLPSVQDDQQNMKLDEDIPAFLRDLFGEDIWGGL